LALANGLATPKLDCQQFETPALYIVSKGAIHLNRIISIELQKHIAEFHCTNSSNKNQLIIGDLSLNYFAKTKLK